MLRDDAHAQWEIQQYGQALAHFVKQRCPIAYQAFQDYVQSSRKLSQGEHRLLKDIVAQSNREEISAKAALKQLIAFHGDEKALCNIYGISAKELLEFLRTLDFRL
jgi:thymidylate synthase ThyX